MRFLNLAFLALSGPALAASVASKAPAKTVACRTEVLEGGVEAGQWFRQPIGGGLEVMVQPIHSGWILRVVPQKLTPRELFDPAYLDYAQLATPPYQSITPLSLSTDFAFRAQDAIGWNPRRFRFATSAAAYESLREAYRAYQQQSGRGQAGAPEQNRLAAQVAQAAEGVLTITDSRLAPGTADQWAGAAAVSSAFTETAHAYDLTEGSHATPLGRIEALRFRIELELPAGFASAAGQKIVPHVCGTR